MREIVLINITGVDRPGLTAAITGVLAQGGVNILDIGQAVIHDTLSFGILVEIPDSEQGKAVLKDILFKGYELDQQVRFTRCPKRITSNGWAIRARNATSSPC